MYFTEIFTANSLHVLVYHNDEKLTTLVATHVPGPKKSRKGNMDKTMQINHQ